MACKNSTRQYNVNIKTIWYLPGILHDSNTCNEYLIITLLLQGYWLRFIVHYCPSGGYGQRFTCI